jgi:SAM-dependent methyltransferase
MTTSRKSRPEYDPALWRKLPTYANDKHRQVERRDVYMYPEITEVLRKTYRTGERVLDVGCCGGHFYTALRNAIPGVDYTGVDVTPEYLQVAREKFPGVPFLEGDVRALPLADASYDHVLCLFVLLHLGEDGVARAVKELTRVAKKQVIFAGYFAEKRYEGTADTSGFDFLYDIVSFDELLTDGWLLETGEIDGYQPSFEVATDLLGMDGKVMHYDQKVPVIPYARLVNKDTYTIYKNREVPVKPYARLVKECQD